MAFYDMAAGQRFADIPGTTQAGIRDGMLLRQQDLFNKFGQGIMQGEAGALAELAKMDPGAALDIRKSHADLAAAQRAASQDKLQSGLQVAGFMAKARNPDEWNRMAAFLRDNGQKDAGALIGGFEKVKPMFEAIARPETLPALKELEAVVMQLPEDQRQGAFNAGLVKIATGTAGTIVDGKLVPASKKEQPGLRVSTDANGNPIVEFGDEDYLTASNKARGKADSDNFVEVMESGEQANAYGSSLDMAEWAFSTLDLQGMPFNLGEFFKQNLQAFETKEQQMAFTIAKKFTLESAMQLVQQTKGAISNKEMEMFMAAAPSMANSKEGNLALIRLMRKAGDRLNQRRQFYIAADQKGVPREKIRSMWSDYIDANPLFTLEDIVGDSARGSGQGAPAGIPDDLKELFE